MNSKDFTFDEVVNFLNKEGYKMEYHIKEQYVDEYLEESKNYSYKLIILDDIYNVYDSKRVVYYNQLNYTIIKFETLDDMMSDVGCIFCGGMYTSICIFEGNVNITKENIDTSNVTTYIPFGNELINKDDDDV